MKLVPSCCMYALCPLPSAHWSFFMSVYLRQTSVHCACNGCVALQDAAR